MKATKFEGYEAFAGCFASACSAPEAFEPLATWEVMESRIAALHEKPDGIYEDTWGKLGKMRLICNFDTSTVTIRFRWGGRNQCSVYCKCLL